MSILSGKGKLPASNRYSRESFQTWRNFLGQRFAKKEHARLPMSGEELSLARSLDDIARMMDDHNIVLRKNVEGATFGNLIRALSKSGMLLAIFRDPETFLFPCPVNGCAGHARGEGSNVRLWWQHHKDCMRTTIQQGRLRFCPPLACEFGFLRFWKERSWTLAMPSLEKEVCQKYVVATDPLRAWAKNRPGKVLPDVGAERAEFLW